MVVAAPPVPTGTNVMFVPGIKPARTIFPKTVVEHDPLPLKAGSGNEKLGYIVEKGPLRGARLYGLTLEERVHCPPTCGQWNRCYGNHMPWAKRHVVTDGLLAAVEAQLWTLCNSPRIPKILVRLHVLGDFPSVEYVRFWGRMLTQLPCLWLYGYTHWRPTTPVGAAINGTLNTNARARILLSCDSEAELDVETEGGYALVVKDWADTPKGFVKCPAELTGRALKCVDCGLCFLGQHNVAFEER